MGITKKKKKKRTYQLGVIGGDREGRLLVSKCSTDKDLRMAGFQTIPPITFLQYWLFTDLKNQMQVHFLPWHVPQERDHSVSETVYTHFLPNRVDQLRLGGAEVHGSKPILLCSSFFFHATASLMVKICSRPYYSKQPSCFQSITEPYSMRRNFRITQTSSSSNPKELSLGPHWHEHSHFPSS